MKVSYLVNGEEKEKVKINKKESLSVDKIIEKLREKNIYFSELCQSQNLLFKVDGKKISQRKNPFSDAKRDSEISIELYGDFITLNYCEKEFNFKENEPIAEVTNTIKKIFNHSSSVSIYFDQNHIYKDDQKLQKNLSNKIEVLYNLKFVKKENNTQKNLYLNFTSTVNDAKNGLSIILSDEKKNMIVEPEKVELRDHKNKKIHDSNKLLRGVQELNKKFYYDFKFTYAINNCRTPTTPRKQTNKQQTTNKTIDAHGASRKEANKQQIKDETNKAQETSRKEANKPQEKIEINRQKTPSDLDSSSKKQKEIEDKNCVKIVFVNDDYYPLNKSVPLSTKIEDIKKLLADEKGFKKDEIVIKYEEGNKKVKLSSNETIEDILDLIKVKIGKSKLINLLHYEITKDQKNLEMKGEEENDNDDEEIKSLTKSKKKSKLSYRPKILPIDKSSDKLLKKKKSSAKMIKYIYQTNMDPEDKEIEMEEDATVKDMKEKIGEEMEINNIYDIKIIFAGKELLNEIVLKDLNVGDIKLFVYIRTQEDILLMTAKALQISEYSSSSSNSEEEDNDDDDDD